MILVEEPTITSGNFVYATSDALRMYRNMDRIHLYVLKSKC